jgi:hypothetical protein
MFRVFCFEKNESFPEIFLNISISNKYKIYDVEKFSNLKICIFIEYAKNKKVCKNKKKLPVRILERMATFAV